MLYAWVDWISFFLKKISNVIVEKPSNGEKLIKNEKEKLNSFENYAHNFSNKQNGKLAWLRRQWSEAHAWLLFENKNRKHICTETNEMSTKLEWIGWINGFCIAAHLVQPTTNP